jgi:hypothetical protein
MSEILPFFRTDMAARDDHDDGMQVALHKPRLLAFRVAAIVAALCGGCGESPIQERRYESRSLAYQVLLRGDFSRPKHAWSRSGIRGTISIRGHAFNVGELYDASYLDEAFDRQFPTHAWPAPNILQLFHASSDQVCDVLSLRNDSSVGFAFVAIRVDDLIMALDIKPGAFQSIPVVPSSDPSEVFIKVSAQGTHPGVLLTAADGVKRRTDGRRNGFSVRIVDGGIHIFSYDPPATEPAAVGQSCSQKNQP